jgi:hypothetical protein
VRVVYTPASSNRSGSCGGDDHEGVRELDDSVGGGASSEAGVVLASLCFMEVLPATEDLRGAIDEAAELARRRRLE